MLCKLQHTPQAIFFKSTDFHAILLFCVKRNKEYLKVEINVNIKHLQASVASHVLGQINNKTSHIPVVCAPALLGIASTKMISWLIVPFGLPRFNG